MNTMPVSRIKTFWSIMTIALFLLPAAGQTQELLARASDKEVKALVKNIAAAEKRFERSLTSQFKRSILRGPTAELQVGEYLLDLSDAMASLQKRFTGSYAASAEATEVLKRSSLMHGYVRNNPSLKGANEWDAVAALLQQLATAYGQTFPLTEGVPIRRIGDGELADAAQELQKFASSFQKSMSKSTKKIPELKDPVKAGVADLKFISSSRKTLASRIRSGKPASAEARQLMEAVERVQALVDMDGMPDSVATEWAASARPIGKISQAFGLERSN